MTRINLRGRSLLVTRPLPEGERFGQLVASYHGKSLLAPVLEIKPPLDPLPFKKAVERVASYDGVILTSANGARAFLGQLSAQGTPHYKVPPLFAVGHKTAAIIRREGLSVEVPSHASGGGRLAQAIMDWQPKESHFLFPRAQEGREELILVLVENGYRVDQVDAYRAEPIHTLPEAALAALKAGRVDAIPLFSGRTAEAFLKALPKGGEVWIEKPLVIAISPITQHAISSPHLTIDLVSREPTAEGLLRELDRYWQQLR
ncbi:MAG: uroporphyrinogen-III synthase [Magnetococcales bacterium]|nr:uroporphyrinogen-III synthase [Magnetococcales bacterium]